MKKNSDQFVSMRLVTFSVGGQWLGIPVGEVQEVLTAQSIASVPLAREEVAGFLNLRGQIVTAVDLRTRFKFPLRTSGELPMNIVVRHGEELFSLLADQVGDVIDVEVDGAKTVPPTLEDRWKDSCSHVVQTEKGLLLVTRSTSLIYSTSA